VGDARATVERRTVRDISTCQVTYLVPPSRSYPYAPTNMAAHVALWASWRLGFRKSVLNGVKRKAGGRLELKSTPDAPAMRLNCFEADAEDFCDLLVLVSLSDQLHNRALSVRNNSPFGGLREQPAEQKIGNSTCKERPMGSHGSDGIDQLTTRIGFEKIASRTRSWARS
jgi:hypothetical protein